MSKPCTDCVTQTDYLTKNIHTWCTSCGNYGIWGAVRNALTEEQIAPHEILFVNDIGCNGNGADKINGYGFKGLHGRALPLACGAAISNEEITVIASAGDGAVLAEGIGHLIHAVRSNYNLTFIIHNNSNFALTTGQASPATQENIPMNASPDGVTADQINIMSLLLPLQPTFAARGFSGNAKQLTSLIRQGINHKGFAIIEVLQNCPTYNKVTPNQWYLERVFDVAERKGYDNQNLAEAMTIVTDLDKEIATGVIYQNNWKQDFMSRQINRQDINTQLVEEVKAFDVTKLLAAYK